MGAFAKAPWRVGPVDDTRVQDADGNEVAQIDGDYNQPDTWPIMEANARLIAASPELLDCLRDTRRVLGSLDAGQLIDLGYLDEVIAKAEGRTDA